MKDLGRIWIKPIDKAFAIKTAVSHPMKSQLVHEWAKEIYASLEAQKQAKK